MAHAPWLHLPPRSPRLHHHWRITISEGALSETLRPSHLLSIREDFLPQTLESFTLFPLRISVCEYAMNMVMRNTNESKLGCHDVIMLKLKSVTFWLSVTDWLRLARYWVVFALEMKIILVNFEFQKVCGD